MTAGLLNYLLYQAGWFACILGAAWGYAALGTALGFLPVAAHLALARRRRDALRLVLWTTAVGVAVDTTQIALGTLRFAAGSVAWWLPPPWLIVIWAQFAMTFHFGLRWLQGRLGWAALFGALGGPLAFLAGRRLGVVSFHPEVWPSLVSLAVTWSLAMPGVLWLAKRQSGRDGIGAYRWPSAQAAPTA